MTTKVTFSLPDGTPFTIDGLGAFENGPYELTEADELAFALTHGRTIQDAFKASKSVKVTGQASAAAKEAAAGLATVGANESYAPGVLSDAPVVSDSEEPGDAPEEDPESTNEPGEGASVEGGGQ